MHMRDVFAVTDPTELEALLSELRFGCLVTHGPGGLFATHLPFLFAPRPRVFAGHIARENPHWERAGDDEALIIFQGLDVYISPNWYLSKQAHGRVVPTWNYEAVHIYGRLTWRPQEDWLLGHLAALTDRFEAFQPKPWATSDAPDDYVRQLAAQVIGLELSVERVEAKRKLSQNRPKPDRLGVIAGLANTQSEAARMMAEKIKATEAGS